MKIKALAGVVGTGAASSYSSGSCYTKMMQLLIYKTDKKKITKDVTINAFKK
jgi:hypothetical protein